MQVLFPYLHNKTDLTMWKYIADFVKKNNKNK